MPALLRRLSLAALVAIILAACQSTTGSVAPAIPAATPAPSGAASLAEASPSLEASSPPLAGQTDTDWGRIWDSLPAGFPNYPGSTPAEAAASGPVSSVFAIQGVPAKTVVDWIRSRLEQATYRTEGLSGPLEDGSFVLDLTGSSPGCRVQVSIAPLGGLTTVMIRYGAACPAP
jgi:hypothetical protein